MGLDRQGGRIDRIPFDQRSADTVRPSTVSQATQNEFLSSFTPPFEPYNLPEYEGPLEKGGTSTYINLPIGAFTYNGPISDLGRILYGKVDARSINGVVIDEKISESNPKARSERVVSTTYNPEGQSKNVAYWIDRNPDGTITGVPQIPIKPSK